MRSEEEVRERLEMLKADYGRLEQVAISFSQQGDVDCAKAAYVEQTHTAGQIYALVWMTGGQE